MKPLKSEGKCVFCEKLFSSKGIGRHITTHLKEIAKESKGKQSSFYLKIPAAEMFLHLLISGSATLGDLDDFLRAIWLECCGHMSSFQIKGKQYDNDYDAMEFGEKKSTKLSKIFQKGTTINYEYDFGSTTQLVIQVAGEYSIAVPEKIKLLSRNEPLPIMCHSCEKKPAIEICSVCIYEGNCLFCEDCAIKHESSCADFADYSRIQVVNSPRMGVCAYEGGVIDTDRDGIWKGQI